MATSRHTTDRERAFDARGTGHHVEPPFSDEEFRAAGREPPGPRGGPGDHAALARRATRESEARAKTAQGEEDSQRSQRRERIKRAPRSLQRGSGKLAGDMSALATGQWAGVSPAGLFLGFVGWAAVLSMIRYGPAGLGGWFGAKFLNKPWNKPGTAVTTTTTTTQGVTLA